MLSLALLLSSGLLAQEQSAKQMTTSRPVAFGVSKRARSLGKPRKVRRRAPSLQQQAPRQSLSADTQHPVEPAEHGAAASPLGITIGLHIPGIGQNVTHDGPPPDTDMAVGDYEVVEFVSNHFQVFDKTTGQPLTSPLQDNLLFPWKSDCGYTPGGDVMVDWDKAHHRWLLAYNIGAANGKGLYPACVAVSTTERATGTWYGYEFSLGKVFADFPKWAIWPSGYFQTNDNGQYGPLVCAYNDAKLRAGDRSAEQICFRLTTSDFHLLPADVDSNIPPPAGQDEFFIGDMGVGTVPALYLYSMHPVYSDPEQSSFAGSNLSHRIPGIPSYKMMCPACIPQLGTKQTLDVLNNALMQRVAYWNDGPQDSVPASGSASRSQHWYANHTVQASGGQAGIRWYEFRAPVEAVAISGDDCPLTLFQSGTFAPDLDHRWMASMAQDKMGNIALGYSKSSAEMYPSIYVTGRTPTDPLGQMEGEVELYAGTGSETGGGRWGDYSNVVIDGSDGCTFWYAQEYYAVTGGPWQTELTSFKFNNCH
jgi:hypothetical protein